MKVGDLVAMTGKTRCWTALVIKVTPWATLIKWADNGEIEDASNYLTGHLEVLSESR